MKRFSIQPLITLIVLSLLFANSSFANKRLVGSYSGFVERMGAGPREAARGNAVVSDVNASPAAFWNPALLAMQHQLLISLHAEERALDRAGGSFGIGKRIGGRMGAGLGILFRADRDVPIINLDDEDVGSAKPYWVNGFAGLGWRTSSRNSFGFGLSYSYSNSGVAELLKDEGVELIDDVNSPPFFQLGWYRKVHERFAVGVALRHLGLNSDLSARTEVNQSRDNSLDVETDFLPKTLHAGVTYFGEMGGQPLELALEVIDYQLADSLFTFDGDAHVLKSRVGADWEILPDANIRAGWDAGSVALGLGYTFRFKPGKKEIPLQVNYALQWERNVYLLHPMTIGLRSSF